ncbi:MAG TPA: hypothetical protein PK335_04955 [Draconibacterium sp.]|nr:hypothetical protein [Draconibacterium sp.]
MNELEDIKLKVLLQKLELEKPDNDFTLRVMNRVVVEDNALEQIKAQKVLGKGFWIILVLFVILLAAIFIMSQTGTAAEGTETVLPKLNSEMSQGINSVLGKMGMVPISVAGILIASSLLLFIDRFITSNTKMFV